MFLNDNSPVMCDFNGLSAEKFTRMVPEERLQTVLHLIPDACENNPPADQESCFKAIEPLADFLLTMDTTIQTDVLSSLTPWLSTSLARKIEQGQIRQMPSPDLLAALVQTWPNISPVLGVEATSRKTEANRNGNGISLPRDKGAYADLKIDHYQNQNNWRISGRFFDPEKKRWREFSYVARSQTFFQEIWVEKEMVFPTTSQDDFCHQKIFHWATDATRSLKRATDSLANLPMQALTLHRIEKIYEQRQVLNLRGYRSQGHLLSILNAPQKTVTAEQPHWDFYFLDEKDRLVVITWNEETDTVRMDIYMGNNLGPDPVLSGPVDEEKARGLRCLVHSVKINDEPDKATLRRLEKKLNAILEFR